MQAIRILSVLTLAAFLAGCGEGDPNKDLKPVDKNAPKPSAAGAGPKAPGGGENQAETTAPGAVEVTFDHSARSARRESRPAGRSISETALASPRLAAGRSTPKRARDTGRHDPPRPCSGTSPTCSP